jgi:hypothetical protein
MAELVQKHVSLCHNLDGLSADKDQSHWLAESNGPWLTKSLNPDPQPWLALILFRPHTIAFKKLFCI